MDPYTIRDWEEERGDNTIPATYADMSEFLQRKVTTISATQLRKTSHGNMLINFEKGTTKLSKETKVLTATTTQECGLCGGDHNAGRCEIMLKLSQPEERRKLVDKYHLCFNCLKPGHIVRQCPSSNVCRSCKDRHHTSLHDHKRKFTSDKITSNEIPTKKPQSSNLTNNDEIDDNCKMNSEIY